MEQRVRVHGVGPDGREVRVVRSPPGPNATGPTRSNRPPSIRCRSTTPDDDLPDEGSVDHGRRHHRTYHGHLAFDIAAHTLFVVGSSPAFREEGAALRRFVERAPSHARRHPESGHFRVEFAPGPWGRGRTCRYVTGCLQSNTSAVDGLTARQGTDPNRHFDEP
ncbi:MULTISPECIES: hypothetical protein [unclassified Streptomyces]|uniref:hypothetical protein n=1 Tax=unclassified Streptomyces TaxID=2593676 RepID=UPI00339FA2B3